MTFTIKASWEPSPPGVTSAELAAAWGSCEIQVAGRVVTLVEDVRSGLTRKHVLGSLYPLAEWIAFNWWSLQSDGRAVDVVSRSSYLADDPGASSWWSSHCLAASGDGYAWPSLWIAPDEPRPMVRWEAGDSNGRVRFLSSGRAWVDADQLVETLGTFVSQVVGRLADAGLSHTALQGEWAAIQGSEVDETEFCRAAARLGLDPYDLNSSVAGSIARASVLLDGPNLDVLLASAHPDRLEPDLDWIAEASDTLSHGLNPTVEQRGLLRTALGVKTGPVSPSAPWEAGYEAARKVRSAMAVSAEGRVELDDLVHIWDLPSRDAGLIALAGFRDGVSGAVLGQGRSRSSGRRFIQARSLWRVISAVDATQPMLIGSGRTLLSQAERAFAAELLAPAAAIAEALHGGNEDIDAVAERFDVSSKVVEHQRDNQVGSGTGAPGQNISP